MATPRLHLQADTCRRCGLKTLTADLDANHAGWDVPLTIAPYLVNEQTKALAIVNGFTIYRIQATKRGHLVAGNIPYHRSPGSFATYEQSRRKYARELGTAIQRIHYHDPPGDLFEPVSEKRIERLSPLIAPAIERHPEFEQLIREVLDPPPF